MVPNKFGVIIIDKVYNFLKSLTLTVTLLSLIAIFSAIGTLGDSVSFIHKLGLENIYYSKWFIFLLMLFIINLVLCTIDMLPKTIALFKPTAPNKIFYSTDKKKLQNHLVGLLKSKKLYIRIKGNLVSAYRYPVRKFAVYGIHTGILIIAFGAFIGSIWGFRGIMEISQGEQNNVVFLRNNNFYALPFFVFNKKFSIHFYKDKDIPSQYKTVGYIIDANQKIPFETKVNHPFRYKGIWFYQASYSLNPHKSFIEIYVNGKVLTLKMHQVVTFNDSQYYLADLSYYKGKSIAMLYVQMPQGQASGWIKLGDKTNLNGTMLTFAKAHESYLTVLSVAKDPGSPIVVLGFIVFILSSLLIFFRFRRRVYEIQLKT